MVDDFAGYEDNKTFWWLLYMSFGELISYDPSLSVRRGFDIRKYLKSEDGRLLANKLERIAYGEISKSQDRMDL